MQRLFLLCQLTPTAIFEQKWDRAAGHGPSFYNPCISSFLPPTMAKKKSLKQLKANTQRNYASQSIAKKPAPEPVEEAEEPSEQQQPEATSSKSAELPDTERHTEADQAAVERSVLQQLAERVRPLVTKEVNRLVKMYDYERRLARSHSVFTWPKPEIQDTVLDMAREASLTGPSVPPRSPSAAVTPLLPRETCVQTCWGYRRQVNFQSTHHLQCARTLRLLQGAHRAMPLSYQDS